MIFFNFVVLDILTSFLGLTLVDLFQDHNHGITKPNQAKQSLFVDINRCFWIIFGSDKEPKKC